MLFAPLLPSAILRDGLGHYDFSGPMAGFMVDGGVSGASTSGIGFQIIATNGGAMLSANEFDIANPDWKSPLHVVMDGAKIDGGHLRASFHFKYTTGSVIEGLRLDSTGVVETYTDSSGATPATKTRVESAALATPLLFGDLQPDGEATPADVDLGPITFSPTATHRPADFDVQAVLGSCGAVASVPFLEIATFESGHIQSGWRPSTAKKWLTMRHVVAKSPAKLRD